MPKECDACGFSKFPDLLYSLKERRYNYLLCPNCLLPFVAHGLPPDSWNRLIKKFPDSFDLHSDFYDGEGNALQPAWKIHYHIPYPVKDGSKTNRTSKD